MKWILGGVGLAAVAALAVTNPGYEAYEDYAATQMNQYLKNNVCTQIPQQIQGLLKSHCSTLIDTANPQLKQIINQSTERQNLLIFSIYRTNIKLPAQLPQYHFESIGVLQQFYTYEAEEI
jgi:hypothetical protein